MPITALLLIASITAAPPSYSGPTIAVPRAAARDPIAVVFGLPLPSGIDAATHRVVVLDPLGRGVPAGVRPAFRDAASPGAAPRWVHVELEAIPGRSYRTRFVRGRGGPDPNDDARAVRVGQGLRIDAAPLALRFDPVAGPLPFDVRFEGRKVFPGVGDLDIEIGGGGCVRLSGQAADSTVLETSTPSRLVVRTDGRVRFGVAGESLVYRVRVSVIPCEGLIRVSARFAFSGAPAETRPTPLSLRATPSLEGDRFARAAGDGSALPLRGGRTLTLESGPDGGTRLVDGVATARPERPGGRLSIRGDRSRVTVTTRHFWQRHPKRLHAGTRGIELQWLADLPRDRPDTARRFDASIRVSDARRPARGSRSRVPAVVSPPAGWMRRHALGGGLPTRLGNVGRRFDRIVDRIAGLHESEVRSAGAFGEWDFGDWPFFDGWGNLEFDSAFGFLLEYYRRGDSGWLDLAEAAVLHWTDVDRVPIESHRNAGLPRMHGRNHGSRVELGHVWIEGLLHAYYITADPFLRDAFDETSAGLMRLVEDDLGRTVTRQRNAAWTMIALMAIHEATGSARALRLARAVADLVIDRIHPVVGLPRFEGGTASEIEAGFRVAPWVTTGILIPGLARVYRAAPDPSLARALSTMTRAVTREALSPTRPGIRAFLQFDVDGRVLERGSFLVGDWAVFAAPGFVDAERHGVAGAQRIARRLFEDGLEDLEKRRPRLDGRARSRILRNAPFALRAWLPK